MSKDNLQTIIVPKSLAKTRRAAERLAEPHARRMYTSRETKNSWRFRQRPPDDFVKGSFRSFKINPNNDKPGIVLVYGRLKKAHNPDDQGWLQFRSGQDLDSDLREWDYWMSLDRRLKSVKSARQLMEIAREVDDRGLENPVIRYLTIERIAGKARRLGLSKTRKSEGTDFAIYQDMLKLELNPGRIKNKAKKKVKKKSSKKAPKAIHLHDPKTMPDPGPMAWIGSLVEWGWALKPGESCKRVDDKGNAIWEPGSDWMFMWSPKYKAVVAIKRPRNMYKMAEVSRYGSAAKMFEAFTARPAENTFKITVPKVKLQKMGKKAVHIVYQSDKWSPSKTPSDYIHAFQKKCTAAACRSKNVQLYCGPNIRNPEVFLCFGGKLTLTERGLVW